MAAAFGLPEVRPMAPKGLYASFFKRIFDIVAVLAVSPVVLVVFLIIGGLIRRDGGPVFYAQKRIGHDGRTFTCWKLRSMVVDADKRLAEHLAANP